MQDTTKKLKSQKVFEFSIYHGKKKNEKLQSEISDWFTDTYGFDIPYQKEVISDFLSQISMHDEDEAKKTAEIIKLYHKLLYGYSIGALFPGPHGLYQTVTLAHTYTRHRLCHIWNFRKSKLIRSHYYKYINANYEFISKNYNPYHIVLTVKRSKDGTFNGSQFYGHELIKEFNSLRKKLFWKLFIAGGEYGMECKKGLKTKGLHIHIHSFSLMYKEFNLDVIKKSKKAEIIELLEFFDNSFDYQGFTVEELKSMLDAKLKWSGFRIGLFRSMLRFFWAKKTEGIYIHVERLYTPARDEKGKKIYEYKNTPEGVVKTLKKKYIHSQSTCEEYVAGIMECIKYHFKPNTIIDRNGKYDIELSASILVATRGMRMYSKFGVLYGVKELNFNNLKEDSPEILTDNEEDVPHPEEEEVESEDKELVGRAISLTMSEMINPWTREIAMPGEYALCVFNPLSRAHKPATDFHNPMNAKELDIDKIYFISEKTSLRDLFKLLNTRTIPKNRIEQNEYSIISSFHTDSYKRYQKKEFHAKKFIFKELNGVDFWEKITTFKN